ncbi:sulfotransferase domain-containing protein [Candidatus Pacearchaeota archaeon]|nr:sulfotransferase domain-containing protein [Candidatus Pacearchaeota archaeon]
MNINNDLLIIHLTHHKCGTVWFGNIFQKISKKFNIKYQSCKQDELDKDTNIWMQNHGDIDFSKINKHYVGSHMIRDPRDVLISGYFYHKWCSEEWCNRKRDDFNNKSFKDILNELSKDKGLLFEMEHITRSYINILKKWNFNNPNILEIKYEDYITNENNFIDLFEKYKFNNQTINEAFKIVKLCHFKNKTKRNLGDEKEKVHTRKGSPGDWKNHFKEVHKIKFKELYPDILIKLGYEKDNNW